MPQTRNLLSIFLLLFGLAGFGQPYEYVYKNPADSTFSCYLKIFPKTEDIKGLIIRDFTKLPDTVKKSPYRFTELSAEAGFMTVITNTSKQFPELYTADSTMKLLDDIIHEVIKQHDIPEENIFIGGISASGTRAMRFAQYCAKGKSDIKIRGVFAVDSPLDLARFYNSSFHHKKNFTDGMLWEANWMLPLFDSLFGGGPDEFYNRYKSASVFTHQDSVGGNAQVLKNTDIILFHEPDIDWWLKERGAGYFDINSFDLAAFTIQLQRLGNENVELITTTEKGYDKQGHRKPHSWSIVDEGYLIEWIIRRTN